MFRYELGVYETDVLKGALEGCPAGDTLDEAVTTVSHGSPRRKWACRAGEEVGREGMTQEKALFGWVKGRDGTRASD